MDFEYNPDEKYVIFRVDNFPPDIQSKLLSTMDVNGFVVNEPTFRQLVAENSTSLPLDPADLNLFKSLILEGHLLNVYRDAERGQLGLNFRNNTYKASLSDLPGRVASLKVIASSSATVPIDYPITDQNIIDYLNDVDTYREKLKSGKMTDQDIEGMLKDVIGWMIHVGIAKARSFKRWEAKIDIDQEQIAKIRKMFEITETSLEHKLAIIGVEKLGGHLLVAYTDTHGNYRYAGKVPGMLPREEVYDAKIPGPRGVTWLDPKKLKKIVKVRASRLAVSLQPMYSVKDGGMVSTGRGLSAIIQAKDPQIVASDFGLIDLDVQQVPAIQRLARPNEKSIAIDLDKTLAQEGPSKEVPGEPNEGAIDAVKALKTQGYEIIIFSARVHYPNGLQQVEEWLKKYDCPFDKIWMTKPDADFFVDDKAIEFTNWEEVLQKVKSREKVSHLIVFAADSDARAAYNRRVFLKRTLDKLLALDLKDPANKDMFDALYPDAKEEYDSLKELADQYITNPTTAAKRYEVVQRDDVSHIGVGDDVKIDLTFGGNDLGRVVAIDPEDPDFVIVRLPDGHETRRNKQELTLIKLNPNPHELKFEAPSTEKLDLLKQKIRDAETAGDSERAKQLYEQYESITSSLRQAAVPGSKDFKFSSVQIAVPEPAASQILAWSKKNIPDDITFTNEDAHGREDYPHITVKYGIHADKPKEILELLKGTKPLKVKLGKISLFENKDKPYDVVKIEVESDDLHKLNKLISDNVEVTDTHPVYKPHLTLAYVKKGAGAPFNGNTDFEGTEFSVNQLEFSSKDKEIGATPIQLKASIDLNKALKEVQGKTTEQINRETAFTWASRAMACYKLASEAKGESDKDDLVLRAEDFRHEALEHASLVGDGSFAKEIHDLMEQAKKDHRTAHAALVVMAFWKSAAEFHGVASYWIKPDGSVIDANTATGTKEVKDPATGKTVLHEVRQGHRGWILANLPELVEEWGVTPADPSKSPDQAAELISAQLLEKGWMRISGMFSIAKEGPNGAQSSALSELVKKMQQEQPKFKDENEFSFVANNDFHGIPIAEVKKDAAKAFQAAVGGFRSIDEMEGKKPVEKEAAPGVKELGLGLGLALAPTIPLGTANPPAQEQKHPIGWEHYEELANTAAEKHGIPPDMFLRLLKTENDIGKPWAVNPESGATGLAQFMPDTAVALGVNPLDPGSSIDGAAKYLRALHKEFGNWEDAVRAYNWGPGNVRKWLANGGDVPRETQDYLEKVAPEGKPKTSAFMPSLPGVPWDFKEPASNSLETGTPLENLHPIHEWNAFDSYTGISDKKDPSKYLNKFVKNKEKKMPLSPEEILPENLISSLEIESATATPQEQIKNLTNEGKYEDALRLIEEFKIKAPKLVQQLTERSMFAEITSEESARNLLGKGSYRAKVKAIDWLKDAGSIDGVLKAYEDFDSGVRIYALHALTALGNVIGVQKALKDDDSAVRTGAFHALLSMGYREHITDLFNDPASSLRKEAYAEALRDKKLLAAFAEHLPKDPDPGIRAWGYMQLSQFPEYKSTLEKGLTDSDPTVQNTVKHYLGISDPDNRGRGKEDEVPLKDLMQKAVEQHRKDLENETPEQRVKREETIKQNQDREDRIQKWRDEQKQMSPEVLKKKRDEILKKKERQDVLEGVYVKRWSDAVEDIQKEMARIPTVIENTKKQTELEPNVRRNTINKLHDRYDELEESLGQAKRLLEVAQKEQEAAKAGVTSALDVEAIQPPTTWPLSGPYQDHPALPTGPRNDDLLLKDIMQFFGRPDGKYRQNLNKFYTYYLKKKKEESMRKPISSLDVRALQAEDYEYEGSEWGPDSGWLEITMWDEQGHTYKIHFDATYVLKKDSNDMSVGDEPAGSVMQEGWIAEDFVMAIKYEDSGEIMPDGKLHAMPKETIDALVEPFRKKIDEAAYEQLMDRVPDM